MPKKKHQKDTIEVTSGVNQNIFKEEWRDEIVGNLFYPINKRPRGLILHLNGSAQLLQDARSICLANHGFMTLELGYNLPQYNQPSIYTRSSFPLEYIRLAAERLLAHENAAHDKLAVLGHSKGGDLAIAAAIELSDIIDLAIVSSCFLFGPVLTDTSYKEVTYPHIGCTADLLASEATKVNGFLKLEAGHFQSTRTSLGKFFPRDKNGDYSLNYDACQERKRKYLSIKLFVKTFTS